MVAVTDPQGLVSVLPGLLLLGIAVAAASVGGVRRGPGLAWVSFLGATAALLLVRAWFQSFATPPDFSVERAQTQFAIGLVLGGGATLALAAFVLAFPRRPSGVETRHLTIAGALFLAATAGSWVLIGAGADAWSSVLLLVALGVGALRDFALVAMPLRFHAARDRPWDGSALAWFGAMVVLLGISFEASAVVNALDNVAAVPGTEAFVARTILAFLVVMAAGLLWLRPTLTGPAEASRTGRNLCLLTFALMLPYLGSFVLGRELNPAATWLAAVARVGALVAVAAMSYHAVFRQRLFEEAPAEAPGPRQVEAPPPA